MDPEHILQDVFNAAVRIIKDGRAAPGQTDLQQVLREALAETIEHKTGYITGTVRSHHRQLFQMLEEWDQTRQMVKTRWARSKVNDLAWKA